MTNNYNIPNFQGQNLEDISLETAIELVTRIAKAKGYDRVFSHYKFREIITAEKLSHLVHKKVSNSGGRGSDATESCGKQAEYKSIADDRGIYEAYKFGWNKKTQPPKIRMIYNGAYTEEKIKIYEDHNHYACLFDENEIVTLIVKVDTQFVIKSLLDGLKTMKSGKTTNFNSVIIDVERIRTSPLFTVVHDFLED